MQPSPELLAYEARLRQERADEERKRRIQKIEAEEAENLNPRGQEKTTLNPSRRPGGAGGMLIVMLCLIGATMIFTWANKGQLPERTPITPQSQPKPSTSTAQSPPTSNTPQQKPFSQNCWAGPNALAALTESDLDLAVRILSQKDEEAFNRLVEQQRAFVLKSGIEVYPEEASAHDGKVRVRPRGATASAWTLRHFIECR